MNFPGKAAHLSFSSNGRCLAAGGDRELLVWDTANYSLLFQTTESHNVIQSCALSPECDTLAVGLYGEVKLYSLAERSLSASLAQVPHAVRALAFSSAGDKLACLCGQPISLWDVKSRSLIRRLDRGAITVAFSPDGRLLGSAGTHPTLWDVQTGALVRTFEIAGAGFWNSVIFSQDGSRLIAGGSGPMREGKDAAQFAIWDVETGELQREFTSQSQNSAVFKCVVSSDTQYFAVAYLDVVEIWMMDTGKLLHQLSGPRAYDLAFSPENSVMAMACELEIKFVQLRSEVTGPSPEPQPAQRQAVQSHFVDKKWWQFWR